MEGVSENTLEQIRKRNKKRGNKKIKELVLIVLNLALVFIVIFPLFYAFSMSIRPEADLYNLDVGLIPKEFTLNNFINVFRTANVGVFIKNSLIVSTVIMVSQLISASLAAFAFRFLKFKGSGLIFALIMATLMIPGEATIISQYLMVSSWGLHDTLFAIMLPYLTSATGVFLFKQSFENFPMELYEYSKIDGCGDFRFFISILLPLSRPTIAALSVISFLGAWNMYMWPLLITGSEKYRTVQIGIAMLNAADSQSLLLMLAGVVICMLPSLTIFLVARKNMIKGLTAGAVKS